MSNESESERIKYLEETLWKVAKMLDMGLGLNDFAPDQETWDEMFECLDEPRMWALNALGMGLWEYSQATDGTDHWVNKWYAKAYGQASE